MNVIGISGDCEHTSAVALIRNGELVYAEAEERLSRRKGDGRFPERVLAEAMSRTENGRVVLVGAGMPGDEDSHLFVLAVTDAAARLGSELRWVEHHHAHARCAAYTASLCDGNIVTCDGQGNGVTMAFWHVRGGKLKQVWHSTLDDGSLGFFFAAVTEHLGYQRLHDEGKVCALAASGRPDAGLSTIMNRVVQVVTTPDGNPRLSVDQDAIGVWRPGHPLMGSGLARELAPYSSADVALAAQIRVEEALLSILAPLCAGTPGGHLSVAGGLFANVRINRRLAELPEIRKVFVAPPMGDEGLAVGAAVDVARQLGIELTECPSMYLGTTAAIDTECLPRDFIRHTDEPAAIIDLTVRLLEAGEVVARCAGPGEFGPRSLGNRSFLYRPDDRSAQHWLNLRLGRDPVMPFAPCVCREDLDLVTRVDPEIFSGLEHMTVAIPVTERFQRDCPGVVHIDGTARVQAVSQTTSPQLWQTLNLFRRRTGLPALLNTSLNRHGEPICRTLDDALVCSSACNVDYVLAGSTTIFHHHERRLEL
jgi:carbamoyltransferase